jgi:putative ABC transport system permease protein
MLKNYLKIALKVFLRRKFFTFISLFGISFTLIVLMVGTAILDHIFGPMPPETKLNRTLGVYMMSFNGPNTSMSGAGAGYAMLDRHVRNLPQVEKVSLFSLPNQVNSYWNGSKIVSFLKRTDGQFWEIYDFNFLEGGPYSAEDEKNGNVVAVINDATRKKFFGYESAVGKTIEADGQRYRVVGVVSNVPILRITSFSDIWTPISASKSKSYLTQTMSGEFQAAILARDTADFPAIKAEFQARLSMVEFIRPYTQAIGAAETPFEFASRFFSPNHEQSRPKTLLAALILLMVLFMLLPTVNLININISRMLERSSEIGVRRAFGASSRTLIGQFVVENVLLTLVGGALGFAGSWMMLKAISESGLIPYSDFHINFRVFLYGLALTIFLGLFSGVYPAWKMSRLNPISALKGGTR